ncbi:MAG: T9SS type A sorting domain-containing protein [Ignavibacteria bacterium]|nr:T9SS type A sorting domain-containing protein [Ignavibacteria bacterium]
MNVYPLVTVLCAVVLVQATAGAQSVEDRSRQLHHEVPNDPYVETDRNAMEKSEAYRSVATGIVTTQVNVDGNGMNIVGDAANEPSIAINPLDPTQIVIGWRQFNTIASDFRQAGYGFTTDGGTTWTFPGVIDAGVFRSDPVLDFDAAGNFYYNSLTAVGNNFSTDVYISTSGGSSWDGGTYAHGGDKQWMAIDRSGGVGDGNIYSFWTQFYSSCSPGFFTRSTNSGTSYQSCISVTGSPYWGTLAVGPDGELYVCGTGFVVTKSTNAQNAGENIVWDFSRTVSLGGSSGFGGGPNPAGLLGQTWIAVDRSDGGSRGNVYLLSTVDPSGSDPADVRFSRSTDGGNSWSSSIRINDDPGSGPYQWFGTMSVAPNGRIDAVWLDTRNDPGGFESALYYSYSEDAGLTWSPNAQLSDSFDPHVGWPIQQKMGDYFDMVSDNEGAHLAWAGTFNGEQDVYYSYITPEAAGGGIACEEIFFFNARCNASGTAQAMVKINGDHAGETVMFELDGNPHPVVLVSNGIVSLGKLGVGHAGIGEHTIEMTDPAGCYDPVVINCTVDAPFDPEWASMEQEFEALVSSAETVANTRLLGNYPNPSNPSTTIRFRVGEGQHVTLEVFNILGQRVKTLVDRFTSAGVHEAVWDGRNDAGSSIASGLYVYRLTAAGSVDTGRLLLMK